MGQTSCKDSTTVANWQFFVIIGITTRTQAIDAVGRFEKYNTIQYKIGNSMK